MSYMSTESGRIRNVRLRHAQVGTYIDEHGCSCDTVSMKNVTVSIDDETHRRARIRAAELGTTLSATVRDFLKSFAGQESDFERRKRLQQQTLDTISAFRAGDRLGRDELYEHREVR
jgi:plasmid stability protein